MVFETQGFSFDFKKFFVPLTTKKAILIIIILGIIVFFNALFNDFVIDDKGIIIDNTQVHTINIVYSFRESLINSGGQYRPIASLYYSFFYSLFGATPFPYHVLQILLHIVSTALLYVLFRKFISPSIALFAALVFLIHPIQVESVSYIAQIPSPPFFLLGIIPLLLSMGKNVSIKTLAATFFLLLLSLLVKETGILFLFVMLVYSFLFARKHLLKLAIGGFITLAVYVLFRFFIGQVGFETRHFVPIAKLSLQKRLLNVPMIMLHYLKTFFFPKVLELQQNWVITSVHISTFYFPLIADLAFLACIFLTGLYVFKHHRHTAKPFLCFSSWFLIGLFFHLNIFPLDATVADRWMYFPLAGLLGMIAVGLQSINLRNSSVKRASLLLSILLIGMLSIRTMVRNANWYNEVTLFSSEVQVHDTYQNEDALGEALLYKGLKDQAVPHFIKSIELKDGKLWQPLCPPEQAVSSSTCVTARDAILQHFGIDISEPQEPSVFLK